jgi:stage II sporulation protein GA (sporulation sigma-E factor processing peptidase)
MDVIVVEKSNLKEIIDNNILENLNNILQGRWLSDNYEHIYNYNFRVIPFNSLGNENGMLLGFKPDYVKIYDEELYIKKNVIVGIYDGKLSKVNLYTSLVGLNILKEDNKNEFITNS